jgi:hypothetical protein
MLWIEGKLDFLADAIAAHCVAGPKLPDSFVKACRTVDVLAELENVAHHALEAYPDKHRIGPRYDIQKYADFRGVQAGLLATLHRPFFVICAFNLLKNAWQHSRSDSPIVVEADDRDAGWLTVRVTSTCESLNQEKLRAAFDDDFVWFGLNEGPSQVTIGNGIPLVRRLASWHRVPGTLPGEVWAGRLLPPTVPAPGKICFTLRLPPITSDERIEKGAPYESIDPG